MIRGYDVDALALVYLVLKMLTPKDVTSWTAPSFLDILTKEWYSAKDLNQIINN